MKAVQKWKDVCRNQEKVMVDTRNKNVESFPSSR